MMDLYTTSKNVYGQKVSVDSGALYEVDKDGICRNVADADADELLRIPSWKIYVPGAPPPSRVTRTPVKSGLTLIGANGKTIELPPPPVVTEPVGAVNPPGVTTEVIGALDSDGGTAAGPNVTKDGVVDPNIGTALPPPSADTEPSGQKMYGEWPVMPPGTDWPDPVAAMPLEYLKLMADAYKVRYAPNIGEAGKAQFIERIEKAMYEPATVG